VADAGSTPGPEPPWPNAGSLLAVYSSAFSIFRARFRPILALLVAASAITLALQFAAVATARANSDSEALASTLAYIVPIILYVVLGSLASAAVAGIIGAHLVGTNDVTIGTGLRSVRPVMKDALAASLLAALVCLLVTFILFFTTLLFLPFFYGPALIIQAIVIQRLPFNQAVGKARGLARGSTARIVGYVFMVSLSAWVIPVAVIGFLDQLDPPGFPWAYAPIQIVVEGAAGALVAVAAAVMYFDLRMRKEDYGTSELRAELT
jgi:hypothetical protein